MSDSGTPVFPVLSPHGAYKSLLMNEGFKMAISINGKSFVKARGQRGHTSPRPLTISLDQPGSLYTGHLLAIFQVSHSTFCAGVKSGRFPKPDFYDGVRPVWKTETIKAFREAPKTRFKPPRRLPGAAPLTPEQKLERDEHMKAQNADLEAPL